MTLLGVVLLLALAAARGWFAPPVRVGAGAVLGLALVGLGMRLHRRETARTGALAVAGTGIATLYLVVAAATALYRYLPVPVGLLLALLVAAGGLALADRWRAVLLGCGTVVGAALLAPVVTERPTPLLVALVLVLQVAATAVALRRRWPVLAGIAAGWPVLYGTFVAGLAEPADRWGSAAASTAVLLVGVAAAAWTVRPEPLPRGLRIGLVVAAPLPALTYAAAVGDVPGAVLAFLAAVLLFAVAALPGRDHVLRVVALAAGAVALFEATTVAFDGNAETAALLGQGVVLLAVAAALRSRPVLVVGGIVGLTGVLSALAVQVPPEALASYPAAPFVLGITVQRPALVAAVAMSALVLAAAVAALIGSARIGILGADARAARLWAPVGLVGLYGAAGLVIALALLVAPSRAGFVAGHAVVTVSWVVVALVLLARGVRRPALRVAGLVLVAAAVAKLVLFDLVALDGLARVAAFLGAGLAAARGGNALRAAGRRGRVERRVGCRCGCRVRSCGGPGIEASDVVLQQRDHVRAGQGPDVVERGVGAQRGADRVQRGAHFRIAQVARSALGGGDPEQGCRRERVVLGERMCGGLLGDRCGDRTVLALDRMQHRVGEQHGRRRVVARGPRDRALRGALQSLALEDARARVGLRLRAGELGACLVEVARSPRRIRQVPVQHPDQLRMQPGQRDDATQLGAARREVARAGPAAGLAGPGTVAGRRRCPARRPVRSPRRRRGSRRRAHRRRSRGRPATRASSPGPSGRRARRTSRARSACRPAAGRDRPRSPRSVPARTARRPGPRHRSADRPRAAPAAPDRRARSPRRRDP